MTATGAGIMPGPAGQSPDYRGVKIVTGATCWRRLRDWHEASVWNRLTDITEFQIPAGKVYLSPVIDGLVVSWSIGTQLDADLANTMLDSAIKSVADCDKQPDPLRPWSALSLTGMTIPDVRCEARSSDNAACEGFFGRLKTELFYPRDWRSSTRTSAGTARRGSMSRLALSAHSNTGKVSESRHNPAQDSGRPTGK